MIINTSNLTIGELQELSKMAELTCGWEMAINSSQITIGGK